MTDQARTPAGAQPGGSGPAPPAPPSRPARPAQQPRAAGGRFAAAAPMLAALGVVYGDIGTSPLYALQTVFSIDNGAVRPTRGDVFGIVSLVFWTITLIVSVKYVGYVLRADNDGEGGVMALAALTRRVLAGSRTRTTALVLALGLLGTALFYGDSVITPAISVLSAVEGLRVAAPGLAGLVLPIAVVILATLFAVQRWGTHRVGGLFGPVMLVWFAALAGSGLAELIRSPRVVAGLWPGYALAFLLGRPYVAFVAMGAVVLAITGAEALYADLGHFGPAPIRRAWFGLVFPALTLNYLAQAGLILRHPGARANPFFELLPGWARLPSVVLATAATVIASQAVISGAYSISRQALRLGCLPHLRIRHTSEREYGQIYVPAVNWALFVAVLLVVLSFRSSARLATAYGVAVTGTFLITTGLFLAVARMAWHWSTGRVVRLAILFGGTELTFFVANLTKVTRGGWLTLLIAAVVFTVLATWQRGRVIVTARRTEQEGSLAEFVEGVHRSGIPRVPGTAVFPHLAEGTTPLALRANVEHNHVLHRRIVIISGRTANVPHIPWERRLTVDHLGDPDDGIVRIVAEFGFHDRTDFPEVLRRAEADHQLELDAGSGQVSYFLSRITLRVTDRPGMARWRKRLFVALARNAASQAEFLCLPENRTVVLGDEVPL